MSRSVYFHRLSEIFKLWELREIDSAERNRMVTELNIELTEECMQERLALEPMQENT